MRKILLLDKGSSSIHDFKKSLRQRGYLLIHEDTLSHAISHLKDGGVDLITTDSLYLKKINSSVRFKRLAAGIPRIVITDTNEKKRLFAGERNSYAAFVPGPLKFREYKRRVDKLLREKEIEDKNRLLASRLKRKEKEIKFYEDIIKTFASTADIKKGLGSILEKTRKLSGAGACSLLFNDELLFEITPLRVTKKINKYSFNKGVGIAGWVMEKGMPAIVHDVSKDRRFNRKADLFPDLQIKSLIYAPLHFKDRAVGVLRLFNKEQGLRFTDDDMQLAVNAANYTAIAIERAFLYEKLKSDELTNLFNSRHLHLAIEMEMDRALRYNAPFSIIFMDIDNFKKVNDTFGHLVGSRTLIEIARILQNNLRRVDVISRYGGDEFVIILPQTPKKASFLVAERLRKIIEKNIFLRQVGFSIRLTASLGIASFPGDARTREELLTIADNAMYRGKFSSKNIVYSAEK